jgi:hypothetical protein
MPFIGDTAPYMTVADGSHEEFTEKNAFERNLILNVLFGQGVSLPDIFFFISHHLAEHVESANTTDSLFEAALGERLVIPYFRAPVSSFTSILGEIRKQKIGGLLERKDAKEDDQPDDKVDNVRLDRLARKFDKAVGDMAFEPRAIPSDVADTFGQDVKRAIFSETVPRSVISYGDDKRRLQDVWDSTAYLRSEKVFTRAQEFTKGQESTGLRRGELFRSLAHVEGLDIKKPDEVRTVARLMRYVNPSRKEDLKIVCRWINQCYQANQARKMTGKISFSNVDPITDPVVTELLARAKEWKLAESAPSARRFEHDVKLAPPERLVRGESAKSLLEVRGRHHKEIVGAVNAWQTAGSKDKAEKDDLKKLLDEYAAALNKAAGFTKGSVTSRMSLLGVVGRLGGMASSAFATDAGMEQVAASPDLRGKVLAGGLIFVGLIGQSAALWPSVIGSAMYKTYPIEYWASDANLPTGPTQP